MSRFDTSFFEHLQNIPVIDLHNLERSEAVEKLHHELHRADVHKSGFCRIVHGVGSGVLARIVTEELSQNPLIEAFSLDSHGGSTTVRFYPHN